MAGYSMDDDPGGGGSHHEPSGTGAAPYSMTADPGVGGAAQKPPAIMSTPWLSLAAQQAWDATGLGAPHLPGTSGPQPVVSQPIVANTGAGFVRGLRDVGDKLTEFPNPEYGFTSSDADLAANKQKNAADRAEFDRTLGDDPSANAFRMFGNVVATTPAMGPVGDITAAGLRMLPAAVTGARGLLGAGVRAGERLISGGLGGGTQAALTSDPSQPLGPQVEGGAGTGALFHLGLGTFSDLVSNAFKRLTGNAVRTDPYTGRVPDIDIERARQATLLQREGVPLQASQISNDPYLQFSNKFGSQAPGSGSTDFLNNQGQRVRNAALQRVEPGTPASLVTDNFVNNNEARIGTMYDNSVRAVQSIPSVDPATGLPIERSFAAIRAQIPSSMTQQGQAQVHGAMNDIEDAFRTPNPGAPRGIISGQDAQRLIRSKGSVVSPLLNSDDPDVRRFGMQIRDQIDQRLRAQMTPDQQAIFDQANGQYRALKTVQNVAGSDGSFTPGQLHEEAQTVSKRLNNSAGTLDEFAKAANTVIQPTLDGRGLFGKVTGTAGPIGAAAITGALVNPVLNAATTGGTGLASAAALLAANRGIQALNRGGGSAAIDATLAPGGGASVADIMRGLDLLRRPVVAAQQDYRK